MTKIIGLEEMSIEEVYQELSKGAKFVVFLYCFSIVILTFKRSSNIYFIKYRELAFIKSIKYTLISLLLGWWGIPWGIIYTIQSIFINLRGGKDVTLQVMSTLRQN
ncbi:hypothetical protein [Chlorogloeopsis sp. ULAP02]|uniref:hypothetical protein n=1 Tax=Chlorogloeopsis sp. ULAP02 TaxID=3107926 RepID=UPI003134F982